MCIRDRNNTVVLILSDVDADIDHNKNHLSQLRYAVTHGLFAYGTSIDINCRAVSDSSPFKQKAVAGSSLKPSCGTWHNRSTALVVYCTGSLLSFPCPSTTALIIRGGPAHGFCAGSEGVLYCAAHVFRATQCPRRKPRKRIRPEQKQNPRSTLPHPASRGAPSAEQSPANRTTL